VADRIKGQDVTVNMVSTFGGVETSFLDVGSIEVQFDREILSEGYLGQTSEQKDDIFKGVSGTIQFHSRTADTLGLIQRINLASQERLPGESFQIVAKMKFPLGGSRLMAFADCKFGSIPLNFGDRQSFGEFRLEFAAEDASILPTP
jgi:hypothetical protein